MPKKNSHRVFMFFLIVTDAVVIALSSVTSFWMRFHTHWFTVAQQPLLEGYVYALLMSILVHLLVFKYAGLYRQRHGISGVDEFSTLFRGVTVSFGALVVASFFVRSFSYSRLMLAFAWGLNIVFLMVSRSLFRRLQLILRRRGFGVTRCLIVGTGNTAWSTYEKLRSNFRLGFRVVGFIRLAAVDRLAAAEMKNKILGTVNNLASLLKTHEIEEVFIACSASRPEQLLKVIDLCEEQGVSVKIIPDVFHLITGPVNVDEIQGMPIFGLKEEPLNHSFNRFLKRGLDIVLTLMALLILAIPLLIIAILIKLESRGTVLFKQERVGFDNSVFFMYKFRSMVAGAEKNTGPVWAAKDDSRRTRFGAFLRSTSFDELPQLFNVLKGDMSLVGPRPERPHFVNQFKKQMPRYLERHKVKVGITGWAQVHGLRGNTSLEERLKYDIYYIENWSLLLDVTILIRTALDLFEHKHAY